MKNFWKYGVLVSLIGWDVAVMTNIIALIIFDVNSTLDLEFLSVIL